MEGVSSELLTLLFKLLPGFVAAAVFYGLTAHSKTSPFERVVEAMIFTVVIQALIVVLREVLFLAGRFYVLGSWSEDGALVLSVLMAVVFGLFCARMANNNTVHEWLRCWAWYERLRKKPLFRWLPDWQWTCRTSYPSEWYSAFSREKRYVTLHLKGDRRLYGWPEEWPDQSGRGQFVVYEPEWVLDNNERAPLHLVEKMVVAATDVEMVEFMRNADEVTAVAGEIERVQELLVGLQRKEEEHGSQSPDKTEQPH